MVKTKRVHDPIESADGVRVLVMRFWPRGVSRERVHEWHHELGAAPDLIVGWKQGRIAWEEFSRRYQAQVERQRPLIEDLACRSRNETLTLLCTCPEEQRCHRSLLQALIERAAQDAGEP